MTRIYLREPRIYIISREAMDVLRENVNLPTEYFDRFEANDWGECSYEQSKANLEAMKIGGHVVGVYPTENGRELSVSSHGDRSVITMTEV